MTFRSLLVVILIFFSPIVFSQNIADCIDAVAVCETTSVNYEVIGIGDVNDLPINESGCLGDGGAGTGIESNSIWFRFKAARNGQLGFNIIPDNPTDDWDFAVYGPNVSCNDLGNPVDWTGPGDCGISNYNAGNPNDGGQTGAGDPPSFMSDAWYTPFLEVNEGEEYLLLINSYQGGNDSFTLEWTGRLIDDGLGNPLDCSIVVGDLGPDQEVCEGTIITLDGTSPSTTAIGYQWFLDSGTGFSEITGETNPIYTIDNDISGIYKVEVTDADGSTDDDEVEINFYSQPTIIPLTNTIYEVFDTDGTEDGFTSFDLRDLFDNILLDRQDSAIYGVQYYQSQADADANVNPIPNPDNYTNITDNPDLTDDIYARVLTTAAPNTCNPATTSFKLLVNINEPPVLSSNFRGAYCPLSEIKIAENFTITDTDDTGLDFFTVQISSGYSNPEDLLILTGTHPNITSTWNTIEGKLTLEPIAPATQILYSDLQLAVREIVFTSTDANITGERFFSFTIGDANYLPSTDHFYIFKENNLVTWSDAKILAEASTYYGLQGYLVTILSEEESIISAEQITGTGWIGASDEDNEGEWKWMTGPETGTIFWNGTAGGAAPPGMYENWNTGEPNEFQGGEDYAHITADGIGIDGSWNDLPDDTSGQPVDFQAKGYIVEYGGTPGDPVLNISTSTSIYIPEITGTTNDRTCTGGSISLSATVTEGEIYWYDALIGGNLVFTGGTFSTPLLNSSTTYYVTASPEGCATTERIAVEAIVDTTPILIPSPLDINRCDENRVGFLDFDLIADQTPQILNSLDPILNPDLTDFEVLYFDTLADAEANTTAAIIANPYRVNTSDNPTIYARIHNINNTTCYSIVEFKLKVTDTPTPTQPSVYRICDDTASGSDIDQKSLFLLNTKDAEILATVTNPGDYFISYHTNLVDAQTSSSSNAIDKNADYEVTLSQRIYVRIENIDNVACNTISDDSPGSTFTSFELIVDPLPIITDTVELKQCDDDTDGFSLFNLNEAASDISTNFANETFVFYPSLLDAENDTNAFTAAEVLVFENRTVTTDVVWARAISSENCYRIAEVTIIVSTTGLPAAFQRNFSVCDDFLDIDGNDTANNDDNDGISAFDFSSVTAEVRALFPASQQLTITYYRNQADALAELNAIADPSNYRNIGYPITQQIYIRVDSDLDNDCLGFGPYITLTVEPVTAQEVGDLELCDDLDDGDGFNGIVQTFNLESQTAAILGTQDPSDFTVTYHNSAADALSGNAPIATPAMYENITPNLETIFVRVENNLSGCFTAQTSFDIIVNPLPVANFVEDLEVCDDNTDGSAQNGFSQSFDLELQTAGILGTQDPAQFTVTYHASLADAQAGALPLGSPFSNSVPFSQIIYVRVYNSLTECANGISNFNAIVNPEPTTENASNLSYCDDDLDGDDTNGFVQNIDLDSQITDILGPLQDPDDFNVTFHETQTDATDGTDALSSPYTNTTANQQTIYVRVENKDTQCVNDDFTFDVIINPLPEFTVTSPQIVCLSGPDLTIFVENPATVYDYVWTDPSGNEIIGSQITISSGGLYTVTATTTNGTGCTRTREILVNESSVATITDADVTIVDDSDNNSITIDPTNLGIGDYQYALIDEDGIQTSFQDLPFFENLQGGFYTIVVEDKNGCRPNAKLLVSVIEFPKFFTPNNDGINDTWAIKGANSTFFPSAQINIFNRFGKIVAQIDIDTQGWDGTYGGKILASDDYWFSIMLVDRNGALRERKGNFSLLRR
ncbi:T9SS type B sorting domain-containing protein [Flavobacteriaceae bacterium]|nr:T9SS type B sorting domain-containing protein [Flavobacteriaceae bacterium]